MRRRPPVDHHVVERERLKQAGIAAHHAAAQHAAAVFHIFAREHGRQHLLVFSQRNVGDKAQPPLIDADERRAKGRELLAGVEHGAVAADDNRQVAAAPDGFGVKLFPYAIHAEHGSGALADDHFAARLLHQGGHVVHHGARDFERLHVAGFGVPPNQGGAMELGGLHVANYIT